MIYAYFYPKIVFDYKVSHRKALHSATGMAPTGRPPHDGATVGGALASDLRDLHGAGRLRRDPFSGVNCALTWKRLVLVGAVQGCVGESETPDPRYFSDMLSACMQELTQSPN